MPIQISIQTGTNKESTRVMVTGEVDELISDEDRRLFGVTDAKLKALLGEHFGRAPDSVYLRDHEAFDAHDWKMTRRVLKVQSAEVISLDVQPVGVASGIYENKRTDEKDTHRATLSYAANLSASSTWDVGNKISVDQTVKYAIGAPGAGVSGETSLNYEASFGVGGSNTRGSTITAGNTAIFNVAPGKTARATLYVSKGVLRVKVTYLASLVGEVFGSYEAKHENHHYWAEDLTALMQWGGLSNSIESTEIIEVGFYADAKVVIEDGMPAADDEQEDEPVEMVEGGNLTFSGIVTMD